MEMDPSLLRISRGDRTRTCDSLVPNQERYQLRYTSLRTFPYLRVQRYNFLPKQDKAVPTKVFALKKINSGMIDDNRDVAYDILLAEVQLYSADRFHM